MVRTPGFHPGNRSPILRSATEALLRQRAVLLFAKNDTYARIEAPMEATVPVQKNRIKTFDSVRAAAMIAVFLFHVGYLFSYSPDSIINFQRLIYFSGTVGVSIFFVLSGFLLFYQMYKNNEPLNKKRLWEYVKKRSLRILPLYYFSLFFIVLVLRHDILFGDGGARTIINNILFIRDIRPDGAPKLTINPVYWSLVIEIHFYVLLPIFYYIFYKLQKVYWFFLIALLGILYRSILVFVVGDPSMQFLRFTPANFDFFAFGMLGAYLYIHRGRWFGYLGKTYIQVFSLLALVLFVRFYDLDFLPTVSYIFAAPILGLLVTFSMLSFLANEGTLFARIGNSRPILFIAQISFSIYIWHAIIFGYVEMLAVSNFIKVILNIGITLVVSVITYYLIEAPFLKLKQKKSSS